MVPESLLSSVDRIAMLVAERAGACAGLAQLWNDHAQQPAGEGQTFDVAVRSQLSSLAKALAELFSTECEVGTFKELFTEKRWPVVLSWCDSQVQHRDVKLAAILRCAAQMPSCAHAAVELARKRLIKGPLLDALSCAPLLGDGQRLGLPENAEARARLEILFWEAGASALEVPLLGEWLWASPSTFDELVHDPAHGALRGRVLAARCLEVTVSGMPKTADPVLVGRTLQILQPLLLHPEPLVWVHAARALGRLTGRLEQLEGTLLDWVLGDSRVLRQRAMTAFASLPAGRLNFLSSQLVAILESPDDRDTALAAVAAATPYLFFENRVFWDRMAGRILLGEGGAVAARALARGLCTLWRRGDRRVEIEAHLHRLRERARCAGLKTLEEARRWIEVTAVTDIVDSAERDPLDLELGLENLIRVAAQYDDSEADARAARFATAIASSFAEAHRTVLDLGRVRHTAAAINSLEGCARAFALRLWSPMLATHASTSDFTEEPNLDEAWERIARAPAEILDWVKELRLGHEDLNDEYVTLEVLAIRLGGYALDACGQDAELGPGRGPTAHETCRWLRKVQGLADGTRDLPLSLQQALSALFWRLVDTTRGTALGEVDDVQWLGPFAAWWALVIDRPTVLLQLATALPMMTEGVLERCCESAETLRKALSSNSVDGAWYAEASSVLQILKVNDTELAQALAELARVLSEFRQAAGPRQQLESLCLELVLAGERLRADLADPVKALHEAGQQAEDSSMQRAAANAPRIAALVARAIRAREPAMLDVWFTSLGPIVSALIEEAVRAAIRRTPPPPPTARKKEPQAIEGYELVRALGEGGIGRIWLVRKPGADRLFVLKIPKADVLANATDAEREGTLATFVKEAEALAGIYHPNVANIIDRGVFDSMPFLVLEYLIGADLKAYAAARPMSLFELRQVVLDTCAGLAALHGAGLVHRDIKPANIWLRLPLAGGESFDPKKHRDPACVQPLSTVVIDFGMVRAIRVSPDASGRFVAGTAGYIAPEQVLDPIELDPRSDVYALAGTVYNATTGRAFFDELQQQRDRIIAHMQRSPFEEPERLRPFPSGIAKLLRSATLQDPRDRPTPGEFAKAFADAI